MYIYTCTGNWIGVELHDHFGPHDGAVRGVRYFKCPPKRGIFVKQIKGRTEIIPKIPTKPSNNNSSNKKILSTKKKLELVDIKSKYTVFGFNREASDLFNYNIPIPITNLCLLFYFQSDKWDQDCIGKGMRVDIDGILIKDSAKKRRDYATAFLTKVFSKGIHRWKFKVLSICENAQKQYNDNNWTTTIGIYPLSKIPPKYICDFAFPHCGGCGFDYKLAGLAHFERAKHKKRKYGKRCYVDDIIEMIVDCDKGELSYIINGNDYGIAFSIDTNEKYRAAVNLDRAGDSIQLL